ncbi:MAG TPA: helicase-exonuclease AddAB subunit AddA [Ruminiclostridium sp.]|nr:helicase-exonuclease AddAB subunit AddA [Ruminiclostridium sp.]
MKEEIKSERDGLKKLLLSLSDGILCSSQADFADDMKMLSPVVKCLCDIVLELDRNFFKAKLEREVLDFSDLEQLALKLLVTRSGDTIIASKTAGEIASRFDEVLVDEYQDTNPAQDLIFHAVSRNGTNLFMVGDVKQSIYSFRQARPELFTDMAARCVPFGNNSFPAKIILGRNFRSRKGVTDAVNFTFDTLMSRELGGIEYGENERLIPAATYFERDGADFAINLIDAGEYDGDEDGTEIEARHIAGKIKQLISQGFSVQGENGPRKAKFRDFCILLRSMEGRAQKYARVLEDEGIPVYADIASGYLGAYEVMVVLSLLKIIDNPLQDVPLISVLMSPVFGFTPDDVSLLRVNSKKKSLYLALLEFSKTDSRFDEFLLLIDKLRMLAAVLPSDRLILRIYDETGILNIFDAMPNGEMRHANLRLLLDYARAYESAGWRGLAGFMRFIERVDRQHSDLAPASVISENADVVRIMSIHKSKGLEFPVCFLGGLSKRFNSDDLQKPVIFNPFCGFGSMIRDRNLNCRYTTLSREVVKLEMQKSMLSEELRVLYVAMTRAREKLYAVMTLKNVQTSLRRAVSIMQSGSKVSYYEAMKAQNTAELILAAALVHPSCGELRKIAGVCDVPVKSADDIWEFENIDAQNLIKTKPEKTEITEPLHEADETARLKAEIESKLDYKYPYQKLSGLPSKVSVSELSHKENAEFNAEHVRPSFLEGSRLSPAQKGTALHTFMQYCDLSKITNADGVKSEIERLVNKKFLLPEQGEAVNINKATAFAASAIFKRLHKAKSIWREFRFNIEVPAKEIFEDASNIEEKILLQGMADLVFEEDGGAVIADYKTDRVQSPETLVKSYAAQLESYAKAIEQILEIPVKEKFIYSFYLEKEIKL